MARDQTKPTAPAMIRNMASQCWAYFNICDDKNGKILNKFATGTSKRIKFSKKFKIFFTLRTLASTACLHMRPASMHPLQIPDANFKTKWKFKFDFGSLRKHFETILDKILMKMINLVMMHSKINLFFNLIWFVNVF